MRLFGVVGLEFLVKRIILLAILVMLSAAVVFFIIAVNHGPRNLAFAFIFVAFVGFTLLPTAVAVDWYLPSGRQRGYGRVRSLMAVAVLAVTFGYWVFAILADLGSPADSFSMVGVGAVLLTFGYIMVYYTDLTRKHKELR